MQRQIRFFQRAQHKAGAAVAYALDLVELLAQQALVVARVLHHHAQQVVVVARHQVCLDHLGNTGQHFAKLLQRVVRVAVERDLYQHRISQIQRLRVEAHGVALDHSGLLHLLDAAPAGRRAQAHGLANLLQAGAGVGLQYGEDFFVESVHAGDYSAHHGMKANFAAMQPIL